MFMFVGVSSGRAQVDPNDPWPMFGQDGPITDEDWLAWADLMWLRCYLNEEDCP